MNVYEENSDHFNPEYLAYLSTLSSRVGEAKYRLTGNADGRLVRMEFWLEDNTYFDLPLPGWLQPTEETS